MVLSPQDIHNKEFSVKMRGYNIDQVNDFLDQIVKDYQITIQENIDLRKSLKTAHNKIKYFDNLKDSLNQAILVAQEAANKVKAKAKEKSQVTNGKARKNAELVVNRSKDKAQQIIQRSIHKANQLIVEATDLRKTTSLFRKKLRSMLESQLELTKGKQWDNLLNQDNHKINYQKITKDIQNLSHESSYNTEKVAKDDSHSNVLIYPDGTYRDI